MWRCHSNCDSVHCSLPIESASKAASSDLAKLADRLTAELNRSHHELKSTKTDSAALAGFLSELAARVGGAPPAKNGPRG
jgi:hypothetical protein